MRNAVIILAVVVGVVIMATGGCDWMNGPAGTEVKSRVRQLTEWDDRAIVKNPVGFLTYAMETADSAILDLEASRIGIRRQLSQTEEKIRKNAEELTVVRDLYSEYRAAYKAAHAAEQWPVTIGGTSYEEPQLSRQVIAFSRRFDLCEAESQHLPEYKNRLERHSIELEESLADARAARGDFSRQLELIRMNKALENIEDLRSRVNAVAADARSLSGEGAIPSIDQAINDRRAATPAADFQTILDRPLE